MPTTLSSIKERMEDHLGKPIQVTAQTGRKRQSIRKGVLTEVYPSLFVIDLDKEENKFDKISFSFSDVLTKNVEIDFLLSESQGNIA